MPKTLLTLRPAKGKELFFLKMLLTYRKPIVALFATIVFALTLQGVSEALTYSHIHVDAVNGTNALTGNGSAAKPYKSITFALLISARNNLPDPWHVHIRPGTYNADLAKPPSEREIFPLNLRSEMIFEGTTTAEECIIDGQHTDSGDVPLLNGEGSTTIRNLTIQNSRRTPPSTILHAGGIVLHNPTGAPLTSTLEACIIHNNNGGGVRSSTSLVLIGNTFSSNNGTAVWASELREVTDNVFSDNLASGIVVAGDSTGNISGNTFQTKQRNHKIYAVSLAVNGTLRGDVTDNTFITVSFTRRALFTSSTYRTNGRYHGIVAVKVVGNVTDNKFVGHERGAIKVSSSFTGDIARNTFTDNSLFLSGVSYSDNPRAGGFQAETLTGNVTHNIFTRNIVLNWGRGGCAGGFWVGTLTGNVTHNTFTGHKMVFPPGSQPYRNGGSGGFWVETLIGNVTDNNFTDNSASSANNGRGMHGGGFGVGTLSGNISHNIFDGNSSVDGNFPVDVLVGGGFWVNSLSGNISHNKFTNNVGYTKVSGGVINNVGGGFGVVTLSGNISHNIFDENQVTFWLAKSPNTVEVFNNIFIDNTARVLEATNHTNTDGSSVITGHATHFMNNLFVIDTLPENKMGLFTVQINSPECRFHNNIFSGVRTAIYTPFDLPITHNLFHNVKISFVNQVGSELGNDLEFWELFAVDATNNLEGEPRFVDPERTRNFHLQAASPAIDAGTNDFAPVDDLDGNARPIGASVDIGPYEFGGSVVPPTEQREDPVVTTPDTTDEPVQQHPAWDVNEDGQTDFTDLLLVAGALERTPIANPRTDVNGDGTVDLQDLTLIAAHLGESTAPAAPGRVVLPGVLPPDLVAQWLRLVRASDDGSLVFASGIANLEGLLASLVPAQTALLSNYPNPFNPETWIPYQLATAAAVTVTIYDAEGGVVRTLELGHRAAGLYKSRSHAAYWDGRNDRGKPVASGVYFYQLTTGDFSETRQMVILK